MLSSCRISQLSVYLLMVSLSIYPSVGQAAETIPTLLQQSRERYEAGRLSEAKAILLQVQQQSQSAGDTLSNAVALSNLALIARDQGDWTGANQAIAQSLKQLNSSSQTSTKTGVLAQVLNVKARLEIAQGNAEDAFETWKQTASLYRQIGNVTGEIQSQLNQAQALQSLGFHYRAYQEVLQPLRDRLKKQPDSTIKVQGIRSLGESISVVGDLKTAQEVTQESLAIAERLRDPQEITASQLTAANLLYTKIRETRKASSLTEPEQEQLQQETTQALSLYEKVASTPSFNSLRARLNAFALLLDSNRISDAATYATNLQPTILALPFDRASIEARLNFANSLMRLQKASGTGNGNEILSLLSTAVEQARVLNDPRLVGNALGNLARAQEHNQQFSLAQSTTEQALLIAKSIKASDQIYRWSAQLGRLQERQGDRQSAIRSYTQAVNTLRTLRSNLLSINSESQLVDQETLEPVHRQLVNLLLPNDGSQPDKTTLKRTREVVESLQLEEINNYLRADCLQSKVEIDQILVPQKTAVVYPIILPDRIAIIVSSTGQEPKLYNQPISQKDVLEKIKTLQEGLRNRISLEYKKPSEQLYQWLIQPIEADLQERKAETLVFVLDGAFRNVPMTALSDGKQFLIEKYSIAVTPGLKLTSPQPLQAKTLSSVAFGLTEGRTVNLPNGGSRVFSELPFVQPELDDLQKQIRPSTVQLNQQFTRDQFQQILLQSEAPIVHLATHGQFSSNREQTFLLASDGVIDIDQLTYVLGTGGTSRTTPIELLVLSACETASGDDRAPLGLAGIALKSGARSTVASLWKVNDEATSLLMQRFYQELTTRKVSKAEALQRAQRSILDDPQFRRHPYFWAPFILIGNWL